MDGFPIRGSNLTGWIGQAMPRREDARLLQGQGCFVDDLQPPDCLFLDILRSPFAAGRITELDTSEAKTVPGVTAVFTANDLSIKTPCSVNPLLAAPHIAAMEPLAATMIGATGHPVAAVVATSRALARDALELISLDVDEAARVEGGQTTARWGQPLPAFGNPIVASVNHALVAPFAMEPRAALAVPQGDGLVVWLSTQTPQRARDDLSEMLGLRRESIRVIAPDVGGAFGGKASLMPEDFLTAFAALKLQRPVKWTASRADEFLSSTQGRGAQTSATMMVDEEGRGLGLRAELAFPLGHWMPYSALAPIRNAGRIIPGPYAIPHDVNATATITQTPAVNIYRGAGRPEAAMILERLMDRAAQHLGLDPLEIRRRNVSTHLSRAADSPCSGDFSALLDRLEQETAYSDLRSRHSQRRAAREICGLGIALYVEPCGQGWESAKLTLQPDGRFLAATGSSAQGQGRETAMAQIAAQGLGVHPASVTVVQGDTADVPEGIGALASRSTAIGGTAMMKATTMFLERARVAAAPLLGCPAAQISLSHDGLLGKGKTLPWADLAKEVAPESLHVEIRHTADAEAWASGAILAEVAIDPDTGVLTIERITWVDDTGTVINPLLIQGQLLGGAAQGVGTATMEQMVYDDGQLQTGSLMDYALPRAMGMPKIRLINQSTPSPANPLGVKGVGEAGCIGIPAAILNAVMDALPPETPDLSLPLTSEKLWRAMTGKLQ